MEIGLEKVHICFQKWSEIGPILEYIGPIYDIDHAFITRIPWFGFSFEIGPEKVQICFKKRSGIGPILKDIGPF